MTIATMFMKTHTDLKLATQSLLDDSDVSIFLLQLRVTKRISSNLHKGIYFFILNFFYGQQSDEKLTWTLIYFKPFSRQTFAEKLVLVRRGS